MGNNLSTDRLIISFSRSNEENISSMSVIRKDGNLIEVVNILYGDSAKKAYDILTGENKPT